MGRQIVIVTNQVAGGWDVQNPETWGGGEETVVGFAKALAADSEANGGVTVYGDFPSFHQEGGPKFVNRSELKPGLQADIAIYFKCPEMAGLGLAPRQFVWTDQERAFDPDPFERIFVCSHYLRRMLSTLMPRAAERIEVLEYGLDLRELDEAALHQVSSEGTAVPVDRDAKLVMHASSPDRGLDTLLDIWAEVETAVPDARLEIAYGWDLFDKCGGSPALKAKIQGQIANLKNVRMARVTRREVHELYHRAGVFAYWCTGGEQYGLSVLKAQHCGAVPLVRPWGALHETVFSGLTTGDRTMFRDRLIDLLQNTEWQEAMRRDIPKGRVPDWDLTVRHWQDVWARIEGEPPPLEPLKNHIRMLPGAPPFTSATDWCLPNACEQPVQGWLNAIKATRLYVCPSLGFAPGNTPKPGDAEALLLGFALEDQPDWKQYLLGLGIKSGAQVMFLVSNAPFRTRYRELEPRDLRAMLGNMPGFQVQPLPLRGDGEGCMIVTCQWVSNRLGDRDPTIPSRIGSPIETVSVCYMVRDAAHYIGISLKSIEGTADEVVVVDTGSTDDTRRVVHEWAERTQTPLTYVEGTSPRFCFDCEREHAVGEMGYGHRVAGFETARNQSIARATCDWIMWIDADEELLNVPNITKYRRPNMFVGYSLQQHHHSCDPPEARKVDVPVRMFRRVVDEEAQPAGFFPFGDEQWPTYGTGLTVRFAGIVHEHPGLKSSNYIEGMGPCIVLADVHLAHRGYFIEDQRRKRFVRNWPLMAADRQKYPSRRLGKFLWLRDLTHQLRWYLEANQNRLVPDAVQLAEEAIRLYNEEFVTENDAFSQDAFLYVVPAFHVLQRGFDCRVKIEFQKPEISGQETVVVEFAGRFEDPEQVLKAIKNRTGEVKAKWTGRYI